MWRPLVLYALAAAVLAVATIAELGREDVKLPPPVKTPAPAATPAPTVAPIPAAGPGLAVGVTEFNPNLVSADGDPPAPWSGARDALAAIHPQFFRLVIDWAHLQPSPDAPPNLSMPESGCVRQTPPCLAYFGVTDQLKALASRQRQGGWQGVVVITGTPDWAASPPSGCERKQDGPRSRPPRADALPAYEALIQSVLQAAQAAGADLRYWSPWNEPNLSPFISPQRAACDKASPSLAPASYTAIAHAMIDALAQAPGDQQLVIGETAGIVRPGRRTSSVQEFIAGLPQDVACASTVYTQHAYIGGPDPVDAVGTALAAHHCPQPHTIWITETGVGPAPKRFSAISRTARCHALHQRLVKWFNDPRVTVAIQYTVREDDRFPTGLFSTDLTKRRPALAEWTAWGGDRLPTAPPPKAAC
jgi:hypothetical protein